MRLPGFALRRKTRTSRYRNVRKQWVEESEPSLMGKHIKCVALLQFVQHKVALLYLKLVQSVLTQINLLRGVKPFRRWIYFRILVTSIKNYSALNYLLFFKIWYSERRTRTTYWLLKCSISRFFIGWNLSRNVYHHMPLLPKPIKNKFFSPRNAAQ